LNNFLKGCQFIPQAKAWDFLDIVSVKILEFFIQIGIQTKKIAEELGFAEIIKRLLILVEKFMLFSIQRAKGLYLI